MVEVDAGGVGVTGKESSVASWTYDYAGDTDQNPATGSNAPKGALTTTKATTAVGTAGSFELIQTTTLWDDLGRAKESETQFPIAAELGELSGQLFTRKVEYDAVGRATASSPGLANLLDETTPQVTYDRFGSPITLAIKSGTGGSATTKDLVTGISKDVYGRLTHRMYANDVTRQVEYDGWTGAPAVIGAYYVADNSYKWLQRDVFDRNLLGRVESITDDASVDENTAHEMQCFTYDGFNRLEQAWTLNTASVAGVCDDEDPNTSEFPTLGTAQWSDSAGPYATKWTYSDSGRIKTITNQVIAATNFTRVETFGYGADSAGAHAVTSVDSDQSGEDDAFTYDGAGSADHPRD